MISGVHAIVFSRAADEVRAFFRDTLGLKYVDAGAGWLIFALPPAELAVHPADASRHEIYLLCDDLDATVAELAAKGVRLAGPITEQTWGRLTTVALPDGLEPPSGKSLDPLAWYAGRSPTPAPASPIAR
jgi:catechol 2,3-dioxygenase-like lactoylglutathione lyase family enzyme